MTVLDVLTLMTMGGAAGLIGSLLGLGGGVFLVPFLVVVEGLTFQQAAGISLMTVIATSSAVSARAAGHHLINLRLGIVLEIATTAGGLAGGLTAQHLAPRTLTLLFGAVLVAVSLVMITRLDRRNILAEDNANPGRLGGRIHDPETGRDVVYRLRRLPVALVASFLAGNVSGLLGIGGGVLKVPALNTWCGIPMRAAAATSAMMIGVTAVATAPIYYAHGAIVPELAAAAVLGVLVGTHTGGRLGLRLRARRLKTLMIAVLLSVATVMVARAW